MPRLVTCEELGEAVIQFMEHAVQADKDRIIAAVGLATKSEFCQLVNTTIYYASQQVSVEDPDGVPLGDYGFEIAKRVGYAFHPSDIRDPAANVEFMLCDGVPQMYLYPDSTDDHNLAITDCDGTLIGYAMNKAFIVIPEVYYC